MFKILLIATVIVAASAYDYVCPDDGQHFYRYPYDCSKFIECNDGKAVIENCIPGLFFEESIGYCDFPDNVNCVVDEEEEEEEEEEESEESEEVIVGGPVGECPRQNGQFAVYLAHSTDCTKFYECSWGTPYLMNCPPNLYFNHVLDVCDFPKDSGCVPK